MSTIVVLFNLKSGVEAEAYEAWARERDLPNVNVLRSQGLLNRAASPYQYVELIELHSLEDFRSDVKSEVMQGVAREFRAFADAPLFIVTGSL
jgi:hypothetical protein